MVTWHADIGWITTTNRTKWDEENNDNNNNEPAENDIAGADRDEHEINNDYEIDADVEQQNDESKEDDTNSIMVE